MILHIIFSATALVAFVFLVRFFMRTAIMCQFCGHHDCKVWDRLSADLQKNILVYFRTREKRQPDTSGIFVCEQCKTIFDDFSGEKANRDVDVEVGGYGHHTRSITTCRTWCKVCNSMMQSCDPDNDNIHCHTCGTEYAWQTHEASGYRFLTPPKDAEILKECSDLSGAA